jgi:HD-GYP domain-containing protein (c-di-GMP phosphodiesterase class II)
MQLKSIITLIILILLGWSVSSPAAEQPAHHSALKFRSIVVLHSYGPDYAWTREINDGVMTVLNQLDWTNKVRVEYIDSKNIFTEQYLEDLAHLYANKYRERHVDGIIASDNNALNFLEKYGRAIFPVAAIVATGINGVDTVRAGTVAANIIIEKADHQETLRQAMMQNPKATTAYIISDSSTTGQALLEEVTAAIPYLAGQIAYTIVPAMSFEDLVEYVAGLNPDDFIYLLPYLRDKTGKSFRQGYVGTFLSMKTRLPIYGSWRFQIGNGFAGGHVLSGFQQGEQAAGNLIDLLERKKQVPAVTMPAATYENLYDFKVISFLGISPKLLPEDTVFLHKPVSFYSLHKEIIIPAVGIIALLSLFLVLVLLNLFKQKTINKNKLAIIALNKEIIDTQRELVTTLGEVIENHSRETGNHVKRVAKISRLLGMKSRLTDSELELLEAASPLHDVGKIGISEKILQKPGKLTENEFEIIKEHTTIGRDILRSSDRELLASACSIAYQHHERWDGTGYPNQLKGEEINIFARITMLADIYDALSSERCYKKAWPEHKVLSYIRNESGHFFDPALVRIFLENIDSLRAIREQYKPENDGESG